MEKPWLALLLCLAVGGCSNNSSDPAPTPAEDVGRRPVQEQPLEISGVDRMQNAVAITPPPAEVHENLLAMRLTPEQLEQGWVRLYDGKEQTGWFYMGSANWQYGNGLLSSDGGEASLFCTSFQVSDFELSVEFNFAEGTESGILLRTSADPRDLERDAYELNITSTDTEYPTGSLVRRQKANVPVAVAANQWHTYRVICKGDQVDAWLNGQQVIHYTDARKLARGYIGLQYTQGVIRFRNILMRPLDAQTLPLDANWEAGWKNVDRSGSMNFQVESAEDGLRLKGGPGQLETKEQWADFILQAKYQVASELVDSGILFRSSPERFNECYECQIYHGPTQRKKGKMQTGAISVPIKGDSVNARVLASDGLTPTYLTIIADESQFTSFVNGVMVADVSDTREVSSNPRSGFRREPGTICLQAPDEATDITFQRVEITPIRSR